MRKTNSCSSYNEYRKKFNSLTISTGADVFGVEQLAMQLDSITPSLKNKYQHPNGIQEVQ